MLGILVVCVFQTGIESSSFTYIPIGPFFYRIDQAPEYRLGIGSMLVSNCLEVLIFIVLRFYFIHLNRKRARYNAVATNLTHSASAPESESAERGDIKADLDGRPNENETTFADITDMQNVKYVFTPIIHLGLDPQVVIKASDMFIDF